MNSKNLILVYVALWAIGSLVAFIVQFFFPAYFSSIMLWGYSPWQREIAFWNLGIVIVAILLLVKKEYTTATLLTKALTAMSFLFGANHLFAVLSDSSKLGHWIALVANLIAFVLGLIVLVVSKKRS